MTMDQEQSKAEHKSRIVVAISMAIQFAASLCPSQSEFVAEATSQDALDRGNTKIRDRKRGLHGAELNVLRAVEGLYELNAKQGWVCERDYRDILILCWNGVGEFLDREKFAKGEWIPTGRGDGPLQSGQQNYQEGVVRPLILASFEVMQMEAAELKKMKDKERKLLKKLAG
jgi:hypothetical protein